MLSRTPEACSTTSRGPEATANVHCGTDLGARRQLRGLLCLTLTVSDARRTLAPRRSSFVVEGLCVCYHPDLQTSAEGADPRGCLVCDTAVQIPLVWEGWVAQPVARSQDFTSRVPTSGNLGGTDLLCLLLLVSHSVNAHFCYLQHNSGLGQKHHFPTNGWKSTYHGGTCDEVCPHSPTTGSTNAT